MLSIQLPNKSFLTYTTNNESKISTLNTRLKPHTLHQTSTQESRILKTQEDEQQPKWINHSLKCLFSKRKININALQFTMKNKIIPPKKHKLTFVNYILNYIEKDLERAKSSGQNEIMKSQNSFWQIFKFLLDMLSLMFKNRINRDQVCQIILSVHQQLQFIRLPPLHIFINYSFDFRRSISFFKHAKKFSSSDEYIQQLMKCYEQISKCYLQIQPVLCKKYLIKFLQATWKLNSPQHEMTCYELMGKYFFYIGDPKKANEYHLRSMNGIIEKDQQMKRLGVSKLDAVITALSGRENQENDISSEDEEFDFIFQEQIKSVTLTPPKIAKQKFSLRQSMLFDSKRDLKTYSEVIKNSNQNIRRRKIQIFNSKINPRGDRLLKKYQNIPKDRVLFSHLTPNRELGVYQNLSPVNQLQSYLELTDTIKIAQKIKKMLDLTEFMIFTLEQNMNK